MVKQFSSLEFEEKCPICLDDFHCARITKCGHSFCLACLLHHAHSFATNNPYSDTGSRCPCCSIPLHMGDVRPVQFVDAPAPAINRKIRLVKLHRVKGCSAPFLPQPENPRRSAPHACPGQSDADALFCRFNYVDLAMYQSHLTANIQELEASEVCGDIDGLCRGMALNAVRKQLQDSAAEADEELSMMERFCQPSSGVHQEHPRVLMADNYTTEFAGVGGAMDGSERLRSFSEGSESNHEEIDQLRSDSVVSEELSNSGRRERGDSIVSHDSSHSRNRRSTPASMFSGPEDSVFYQSEDGRLCFLCGFDMQCLKADFSDRLPEAEAFDKAATASERRKLSPLPDFVEGRILEMESIHLTPDKRQRLRFLSHLPLYTDVCLVELSLGSILSKQTRKTFAKEFQRRKNARMKKVQMEKREDARVQREEEARVNELKARMQRIDPDDDFFHHFVAEPEPTFDGDDFGPSVSGVEAPRSPISAPADPGLSFSQITRLGGAFPSLASDEAAFPALGSSPSSARQGPPAPTPWGAVTKSAPAPTGGASPAGKKKKGGGKKIVLFSTGGSRGDMG